MPLHMTADEKRAFFRSAKVHELRLHRCETRADGTVILEVKHEPEDFDRPIRTVGRVRLRENEVSFQLLFPGVSPHVTNDRHLAQCVRDTLDAYKHDGRPLSDTFYLIADKPDEGSSSLPLVIRTHIEQVRAVATV
jgi:hypothetical protein